MVYSDRHSHNRHLRIEHQTNLTQPEDEFLEQKLAPVLTNNGEHVVDSLQGREPRANAVQQSWKSAPPSAM